MSACHFPTFPKDSKDKNTDIFLNVHDKNSHIFMMFYGSSKITVFSIVGVLLMSSAKSASVYFFYPYCEVPAKTK